LGEQADRQRADPRRA
jgi:Transposase DDE domain group 1